VIGSEEVLELLGRELRRDFLHAALPPRSPRAPASRSARREQPAQRRTQI
jgi:hypothetical protein